MSAIKAMKNEAKSFGVKKEKRVRYSLNLKRIKHKLNDPMMSSVRNSAALMKISHIREEGSEISKKYFTSQPQKYSSRETQISDKNFTLLEKTDAFQTSQSKPLSERPATEISLKRNRIKFKKKGGDPQASLRLRFKLLSSVQKYALRITDVSLPERPTRQARDCYITIDGLLNLNGDTVIHPSAVISWAKFNYPRTLLWEVKEQTTETESEKQVLIRHITFLHFFSRIHVPVIYLQIMGFFAELDSKSNQQSSFTKMLNLIQREKKYLLSDFGLLSEEFRHILPQEFHQPYIEGFGPPFLVEFLDMEILISGITEFKILKNISVLEQLTQRIIVQKQNKPAGRSSPLKVIQQQVIKEKKPELPESFRLNEDILGMLRRGQKALQESGMILSSKNLDTINENNSIDKSIIDSVSQGPIKSDIKTITDSKGQPPAYQSPELSGEPSQRQSSKVILSVRSNPNFYVQIPSKISTKLGSFKRNWLNATRSSDLNSQHTFTPPQALSPRIESLQGGYYRIPNLVESKSYEKSAFKNTNSLSILRAFPSEKIDLKKLIPKIEISQKSQQIQESTFQEKTRRKSTLPPLVAEGVPEVKPILKVKAIMKKRSKEQSPEYRNKREIHASPPKFFNLPVDMKIPQQPVWMRKSEDELVVKGVQLIESNFDNFDPQ